MSRPYADCPLVVAYGLGVDSTAMLVEFAHRGICPDLILFADTGGEKPETYAYLPTIQEFLSQVGFPAVTTVRYQPRRAAYHTLEPVFPRWLGRFGMAFAPFPRKTQRFPRLPAEMTEEPNG